MWVVIESGSTKADWKVIDGEKELTYKTKGFNPIFHSSEDLLVELENHPDFLQIKEEVEAIYFYGAGCANPHLNAIIEKGLQSFFINATIQVNNDLMAAAHACYSGKDEIVCILGTGSNAGFYDGEQLTQKVPSLGYVLGDEASGCYFGKIVLADFLLNRLPNEMHQELISLGLNKDSIISQVYKQPNANVFIASMMPIVIKNKHTPYVQKMVKNGFQLFIDKYVKCYEDFEKCQMNFVGSIASLMVEELVEVCELNGIPFGQVVRKPLDKLVVYHKTKK